MSNKKVFVRLGVSDIILSKEDCENLTGHITLTDKENEYVTDVETYTLGYEFEDGTECDEEGNVL